MYLPSRNIYLNRTSTAMRRISASAPKDAPTAVVVEVQPKIGYLHNYSLHTIAREWNICIECLMSLLIYV